MNHDDVVNDASAPPAAPAPEASATGEVLLRATGLTKSFFGTTVLRDAHLELLAGEVHGLVGENGAGKSTLMKILAGVHQADSGTVEIDGQTVSFSHPLQAQKAGLSTVFQEFNLLPDRTIAENIWLGREPRRGPLVHAARMNADTAALLEDLGVEGLAPTRMVRTLSVAEQQVVEIAKAMSHQARIISMDEPTAALADHEVALLYSIIERLTSRGVAILYVSHRLREIFDLCQSITVLKDGELVATRPASELDERELVRLMVGRSLETFFPAPDPDTQLGPARLQLLGVGNGHLDGIDLSVHGGEIVGLAGLQGSGRTELVEAIFGVDPPTRGEIRLDDEPLRVRSPRAAIRRGIALVTEDRKAQGLALGQSILDNALGVVRAVFPGRTAAATRSLPGVLTSLEVAARSLDQEVQFLSGGNQQKVVLSRWLATDPGVVLLDEPTRGIDVGAKHAIYQVMRTLAAQGVAVLMVSSELPEVIGMSDRVVVMRDGRIAGELTGPMTEEDILAVATGAQGRPTGSGDGPAVDSSQRATPDVKESA